MSRCLFVFFSTCRSTCVARCVLGVLFYTHNHLLPVLRAACLVFCSILITTFLLDCCSFYKINRHLCHGASLPSSLPIRPILDRNTFEEEEPKEGIGVASDVVKMEGEDPATQGCLREVTVRWCVGDAQSWVRAPWLDREEPPAP